MTTSQREALTPQAQKRIQQLSLSEFLQLYSRLVQSRDEVAAQSMLIERCRLDVELFARAFFPHYCKSPFNQFHRDCFAAWRSTTGRVRWADAAPRGAAKSTIKALIKPIHDLCYGLERYVVIISNTASQAAGKLKDIRTELLENVLLAGHFGTFFDSKHVAETSYVAQCQGHRCMFQAFGAGTEIRGIRFGESRPSKIIVDDAEHSDEVHNEEIRTKYEDWFRQVVSKLGDEKTKIEVIGTILHRKSLLAGLLENPAYTSKRYQAIQAWSPRADLWEDWRRIYINLDDADRLSRSLDFYLANKEAMLAGTSLLWPERESYLDLMEEMIEIGRKAFMKERQNDPQASDDSLFDDIAYYREVADGYQIEATGQVIPFKDLMEPIGVMDPATGQTKPKVGRAGDYTCILTGMSDQKGRLFVHNDWTKRGKPTEYIDAMFELNEVFNYARFGVETNLYRNLLLPNIETERKKRESARRKAGQVPWGIEMHLKDIEQTENKHKRIHTLEPKVKNRYILFNRALSSEFINQLEAFPDPGAHDDGPDALEMLWSIHKGRYGMGGIALRPQTR